MKRRYRLIIVLFSLMMLAATGPPPLPSSFWGTVEVDGAPVAEGTVIFAWIDGVKYDDDAAKAYVGWEGVYYAFNVPGDQVGTDPIEGGVEGDIITFRIGDLVAQETAVWHSGTNVRLNLTATSLAPVLSCRDQCRQYRAWRRWRCLRRCKWLRR